MLRIFEYFYKMNRLGMKAKVFFLVAMAQLSGFWAFGQQDDRKDKTTAVTFEELYDEPYAVNKLFVGFQPFYGEVFATNVNAGYGLEASYYYRDKFDLKANFRKSYSSSFYDLNRDLALKNTTPGITTKPQVFNYFELGGTYHFKDFEEDGTTKIVLYKKSYKGNLWAARVPLHAVVPCKIRKVYGARLGAIVWNSTTDLSNILKKQGLTNADLKNSENAGLPITYMDQGQTKQFDVFGNVYSTSIYAGASLSWIKNLAVSFDKYDQAVDDGMFTLFFDLQYAPSVSLDPIKYTDQNTHINDTYSTKAVKTTPLGFRFGLDGKYNRQLSFGYGGEIGYRPSIQGRTFYAMFKISFPLYGTNLDYKVESFGK
jgi:hypothetical protein